MEKVHGAAARFSFRRKGSDKKNEHGEHNLSSSFDCDKISYLSQSEAYELQTELQDEYSYSLDQLTELAGLSSAAAIVKSYPRESLTKSKGTILVVCGPGFNGAVGLVCARYLRIFDYRPTIFYPKRPAKMALYAALAEQCERQHIPFLSYMPSEAHLITSAYNLIVDALLGCGFRGPTPEPDMQAVLQTMIRSTVPIASIDVPSGWAVDCEDFDHPSPPHPPLPHPATSTTDDQDSPVGGSSTPVASSTASSTAFLLEPDVLISLTAPKRCSRAFRGRAHYLANRYVPLELLRKYDLGVPQHLNTDLCVELSLIQPPTTAATHNSPSSSSNSSSTVCCPASASAGMIWHTSRDKEDVKEG
jgi:NAD(P)H-hydrate epimerase